jgi:hypothetical protein
MTTQVDSSTQTQPADPIEQARQLVALLSQGDRLHKYNGDVDDEVGFADDRTLVLAAVGLAIAHHISRVADALEERKQPIPF